MDVMLQPDMYKAERRSNHQQHESSVFYSPTVQATRNTLGEHDLTTDLQDVCDWFQMTRLFLASESHRYVVGC
jgi:hypothetical protein